MNAHPRVDRRYRIPRFNELPERLKPLVHNCPKGYKYKAVADRSYPPFCANCNKVVPWFVFKCVVCEQHFIKDFRHPKFCPLYPTCWNDTLPLEWVNCPDHIPDPTKMHWFETIVEPKGLNPTPIVIDLENDPDFAFLRT
jgi:hypothetical protein